MYCENCGKKLIRGYAFCMECGTPVPAEVLEEGGVPARTAEDGQPPAESAEVQASMPGIEPISTNSGESLVFCPNCGMHMQSDPHKCEKCGMILSDRPNKPTSSGGVPLINNDDFLPLYDQYDEISDNDIEQINSFVSGDPFGTGGISASDMAALTQQLASFSASSNEMPSIDAHSGESSKVSQKEPEKGEERRIEDFPMGADDADDSVPISNGAVPVIEGNSMENDPAPVAESVSDVPSEPPVPEKTSVFTAQSVPTVEPLPEPVAESVPDVPSEPTVPEKTSVFTAQSVPTVEPLPEPIAESVPDVPSEPTVPEKTSAFTAQSVPTVEPLPEPVAESISDVLSEPPITNPPYEPIQIDDDFIPEEAPFISEYISPQAADPFAEPIRQSGETVPLRRPDPAPTATANPEQPKGNLVYCRNCGQDMYDTEKFCKNCNAPYKGAYVPPKNAPSKNNKSGGGVKVFGIFPLPSFIGLLAVIAAVTGIVAFGALSGGENNPPISDSNTLSANISDTQPGGSDTGEPSSEPPEESSTSESSSNTSDASDVSDSSSTSSMSSTSSTSSASSTSSTGSSTTGGSSSSSRNSSSASSSTSSSTTRSTASTTKSSSSTKTNSSSSSSTTPSGSMSAKVTSLEKDRESIMSAAAVIAGEVGKLDAFAQNVIYAMDNSSNSGEQARKTFYNRDFSKNMLKIIDSGKSAVDSAVSKASPKNSELDDQYEALETLKSKYTSYYNFIKSPSGDSTKFSNSCASNLNAFNNALKSLNFSNFMTSNYTEANKNSAYVSAMSDAVKSAKNAVSALTSLRTNLVALGSSKFESSVENTLSGNTNVKLYANAAGYSMQVNAYKSMMSGVSSSYSSAHTYLSKASGELMSTVETYSYIKENSFSNYKTESNDSISAVNSAVSSLSKAIS